MRTLALGLLLRSRSAHAGRGPASFLSFRSLATGDIESEFSNVENAEEGALSFGASQTRRAFLEKKKAPRLKAGYCNQDLRCTEEILTVKAENRAKAKIAVEVYSENSANDVAAEKATSSPLVALIQQATELCEMHSAEEALLNRSGKTEDFASYTEPSAKLQHSVQEDLTVMIAKLDVSTYRYGDQWEKVARKLLDKGISLAHVVAMLKKCRPLRGSTRWVDSAMENCLHLGMSQQQIGRVFSKWPSILNVSSDMFRRKIEFFESIGIDRRTFGRSLCDLFMTLSMSVSNLTQKVAFWKDYMKEAGPDAFHRMLLKNPELLMYSLPMKKLAWLETQEFDKKWLVKYSSFLGLTLPLLISKSQVLESFGILNARKRVRLLILVHSIGIPKIQAGFENLLAAGFSRDQALDIVTKSPMVLSCTEDNVNLRVNYFFNVMNASVDAILSSPGLWSHNFESRVKYRYEIIKSLRRLGVLTQDVSLGYMVCMSNANFNRLYVARLEDVVKKN